MKGRAWPFGLGFMGLGIIAWVTVIPNEVSTGVSGSYVFAEFLFGLIFFVGGAYTAFVGSPKNGSSIS